MATSPLIQPPPPATVLLVEDSVDLAALYQAYLSEETYNLAHVETGGEALTHLQQQRPEVVLLDLGLPDMDGMDVLQQIYEQHLSTAVIIVTAKGSVEAAVQAMQYGALDFLEKPFEANRLIVTVRNALQHHRLTRIVDFYKAGERTAYCGLIGASLPMQVVYRTIDSVAMSKAPVFVTGESGTGKELCAQAVHSQSQRRDKPLVVLNCAAIPKDLMESEIFGHVKGAFTGAVSNREGAAGQADGGTLFLDEIGELPLDLQSKLLRFVQTGAFLRVGCNKEEQVDVRFVCATNRDPAELLRTGRFREDLYYRLHVLPVHMPPLREREVDTVLIARHFLNLYTKEENKNFRRLHPDTETLFLHYQWPGNVRELQNIIRNCVVLHDGFEITPAMLPEVLRNQAVLPAPDNGEKPPADGREIQPSDLAPEAAEELMAEQHIRPLAEVEKTYIQKVITRCEGNIGQAAKYLQINPSTIYRKLQQWQKSE